MKQDQQPTPTNYEEALAALAGKQVRKIANNTYLEQFDMMFHDSPLAIGVRLHGTYVVTFYSDGTTELNSGGYQTVTTKERLNRYIPEGCTIAQRDGRWRYFPATSGPIAFYDRMAIDSNTGELINQNELTH